MAAHEHVRPGQDQHLRGHRDDRGDHDPVARDQQEVEPDVERERGHVEPERAGLAVLRDQRQPEDPVDPGQRAGHEQDAQRLGGAREVLPTRQLHDLGRQDEPSGDQRYAQHHEQVGGHLDHPQRPWLVLLHRLRQHRERCVDEHVAHHQGQLKDPVGERVEADLAVGLVERDDQGVRAEVERVDRERQAQRQRRHQQRPPHGQVGAKADRGEAARVEPGDDQRGERTASGREHHGVEAEVEPDHEQGEQQGRGAADDVAHHRPAHLKPRLQDRDVGGGHHPEQERDAGEQDRHPHVVLVGEQQADAQPPPRSRRPRGSGAA